jgi:hypothetical protein
MSSSLWGKSGHFVRIQWVDDGGVTVDDPFGTMDFGGGDRAHWTKVNDAKKMVKKAGTTTAEELKGAVGQDSHLSWAFLSKYGSTVNRYGG